MSSYAYWRAKLAGQDPDPPADRTQMPCGFWRMRDGSPLAVWIDGGRRIAWRGFTGAAREMAQRHMESVAEQGGFGLAVTEDAYRAAFDAGRWPDTDAIVADQVRPPSPGSNLPADPAEVLRDQIEAAAAGADAYAKIGDDETAKRAQSLRSRLLELSGEADKTRKIEKEPHFRAGKAVDEKWMPLVEAAKSKADMIRGALSAHETAKARAAAAEQARIDAERRKAEAELRAAEEAGKPLPAVAAVLAEPARPAPAPVTQIRGGYGRTAKVRVVQRADVRDYDMLYAAVKERQDVKTFLAGIAQKALDTTGEVLPGVVTTEERRVS